MPGYGGSKRSTSTHARRLACAAGWALAAAVTLIPGRAPAQPAAGAAPARGGQQLEYDAPPHCPSRNLWSARVLARLADGSATWSLARVAAIPARVTVNASGTEALIVFHEGGVERAIIGADCEEVASAAALILAIALGSSAREAPATPSHRQAQETPVEPRPASAASGTLGPDPDSADDAAPGAGVQTRATVASASPALAPAPRHTSGALAPAPGRTSSAPPIASAASEEVPDPHIDTSTSPPAPERRFGMALGAAVEANGWVGPWPAGVLGLSLDLTSPGRGWSARIAGVYGTAERVVDQRRAEFEYWGGHLDLCPFALGSFASWRWTNCAELHLGLLHASGDERSALTTGFSQRALLATGVASTRLRTPPLWAVRLELEAGVAVPVLRQTFQFGAPEQVMFESPAVGLLARAGLVVPFAGGQLD